MQQHKAVFALSLCRKAGALVTGFDAVKESVYKGKAALVLCAQDASEGTQARVRRFCEGLCQVLTLPCTCLLYTSMRMGIQAGHARAAGFILGMTITRINSGK